MKKVDTTKEDRKEAKRIAGTVFNKHFKNRKITPDTILKNGVHREDFLAECWKEFGKPSISDAFLSAILALRKNKKAATGQRRQKKTVKKTKKNVNDYFTPTCGERKLSAQKN